MANRVAHSPISGAWVYDANNRLLQRGSAASYTWDDNGNLKTKTEGGRITHYAYDTQNRLIEVRDTGHELIARYGYDPFNRRTWKEQYRDAQGNALAQARRTLYLYADEGLIAEATQAVTLNADGSVSATSSAQVRTQYGPTPDSLFTTDVLFVKTKNTNGQDTIGYLHHDHLGTPIQATDQAGRVVWSANYNAFGQADITTPSPTADRPTISVNLRLPGQYLDEETGLHYNWNRYYEPPGGRYIQSDPIGLAGGINTYAYVNGSPVGGVDPTGEIGLVGGLIGGLGDLGYQLYKNGGNFKCVNWWEVGSWALTGSGAGIVGRAGLIGIANFFSNANKFRNISRAYWGVRGGANGMSLDHWMISQAAGRSGAVSESIVNGGWNLLEMPRTWNTWLGFAPSWGGTDAALAAAARLGIQLGVPGVAAASGYAGYQIGTNAQQEQCGCK